MIRTFTENDLVAYIYGELDDRYKQELKQELFKNAELQDQLNELSETMEKLNKTSYQPSRSSINRILDFSRGFQTESV